jgi:hypothetical protein
VHDDAAEIGLASATLAFVVEMQRVVVERGIAEQPDGFAGNFRISARDGSPALRLSNVVVMLPPHIGRIVQPRPEQNTSPLVEEDIVVPKQPLALVNYRARA